MRLLSDLFTSQPQWINDGNKIRLFAGDEKIVTLKMSEQGEQATFRIDPEKYYISNEGFWMRQVIIKGDKGDVLILRGNFKDKSSITFMNGNIYSLLINRKTFIELQFIGNKGTTIFDMKTERKPNFQISTRIYYYHIPKMELLFLYVLGAFISCSIVIEQDSRKVEH